MNTKHAGHLDELVRRLESRGRRNRWTGYRLPALWDTWGSDLATRVGRWEIAVDPYAFALECIREHVLPRRGRRRLSGRSLSRVSGVRADGDRRVVDGGRRRGAGDWLRTASLYGMLVRTTTAWDHDGDGALSSRRVAETGTFLKSILLLPLLRRMGISVIYLLPVAKHSNLYRKGELGCPYSAKDFFALEPTLHDRLLGDDDAAVEMEFGAFVEAAHAMGMRVMIDIAPRTAARDSDMIIDHPDWFYWIDRREERSYGQPYVPGADYLTPKPSHLPFIHSLPEMRAHLARFRFAPNVTAPAAWKRFTGAVKARPPKNLLQAIGREFGVITPPGFSDVVNDCQPPWSDVTFLRYYWDHPTAVQGCLADPANQPPYLYSEVMKSSRFSGRQPNRALWTVLSDILPFYQRFGVDGARIDMGHALPKELESMILTKARRRDADFGFIAEELGIDTSGKAKRAGYNMIIGPAWWLEPRAHAGKFHALLDEVLPASKLPMWAASETPDTPRAVTRRGTKRLVHLAATLNQFLPNAVPFLNSGLEVYERQPMNLGLDATEKDRFALPKSDPFHGKLAFFDRFVLHWTNAGGPGMVRRLAAVAEVRSRFAGDLARPTRYFKMKVGPNHRWVLAFGVRVAGGGGRLVVVANTDFRAARRTTVSGLPRRSAGRGDQGSSSGPEVLLAVGPVTSPPKRAGAGLRVALPPGGVQIILA